MTTAFLPGLLAGGLLLAIVGGAFGGLILAAGEAEPGRVWIDSYVWSLLRFSIWQAFLSTVLSVGLAIPVARAFARRRFRGRDTLLRLLSVPLVVPVIVGVLGIVAVYGRSGAINRAGEAIGLDIDMNIYGLSGILIAHVFYNLPLAIRALVQSWSTIPSETWRLAAQLGMTGPQIFRLIEFPVIRQAAPGLCGLIFLLCFTSFAIVLVLGGGPPNATLEVAIYQALRFDFNLSLVITLAALQIACCMVLLVLWQGLARPLTTDMTLAAMPERHDAASPAARAFDGAAIGLATLAVGAPMVAVGLAGLSGPILTVLKDGNLWLAVLRSLSVGVSAGLFAVMLAWGLVSMSRELRLRHGHRRSAEAVLVSGSIVLMVPPFVVGAGLFVLLREFADALAFGLVLVAMINGLMGLPFAVRILAPTATVVMDRHMRLADSLGVFGWNRFRLVDWPLLRRPTGFALALCSALAIGDLGVIAMFGTPETETLPLYLYHQMGTYRLGEAAVTALVLVALSLGLFVVMERIVGGHGDD